MEIFDQIKGIIKTLGIGPLAEDALKRLDVEIVGVSGRVVVKVEDRYYKYARLWPQDNVNELKLLEAIREAGIPTDRFAIVEPVDAICPHDFLKIEYVEGIALEDLPKKDIDNVIGQVKTYLDYLWEKGFVLSDIVELYNLENVIVQNNGEWKIIDYAQWKFRG